MKTGETGLTYSSWRETGKNAKPPDGLLFCEAALRLHKTELPLGVTDAAAAENGRQKSERRKRKYGTKG